MVIFYRFAPQSFDPNMIIAIWPKLSKPGSISRRFYSVLTPRHRKGFEVARNLVQLMILLRFFNDESRGTPRDFLSRSVMEEKNLTWSYNEEAAVIKLW